MTIRAMRRKHGIPDSDCRPFAVAYAAATRARAEREAQERITTNKVTEERPETGYQAPLLDAHGLRRRAAEPVAKPHVYQLPATRRTVSGLDHRPNGFDFGHRYNPRLRDSALPVSGELLSPGKRSSRRRASRKDLVFDTDAAVEGKKRSLDHDGNHEPETSKKSRVDSDELIDVDEEPEWHEEEDEAPPTQRGSKRMFDSDEEADYMRTDGRDKRPRNMSRAQTPEDQEMEDVEDDDVAELRPIPRGKKRDRAEAGSTFGGDDEDEAPDGQDDKVHRHRKRRTVRSRKSDISSRGMKRDRDPESPASDDSTRGSHRHSERTLKKKRGKKASSEAPSDAPDGSQDHLCKGRKLGEEWESKGVQYKLGNEGVRLRLTLVKKARSKYSMPRDSQHPDRQANMEIYVETWLTDEQYKDAEERQELVWQETPRVSIERSTPSEAPASPAKTGKDLLWDSMKDSPVSGRAFRQSLTNGSARVNPFKQPLPQATTGRRVASSNIHTQSLIPGVAEGPSRPGFRAFSKWEKQDLEAEAMARMRARMLEQKKAETPQGKTSELPTSATAPELGPKAPTVPIITFTPPPPATSTATSSGTETKPTPSLFPFGPTSTSTDASKSTAPTGSAATPASVVPATSAPTANKLSLFPTPSAPQTTPAAPASSFSLPTTQPPTTTIAPNTASAPSIPNFFAKPAVPSTPTPATTASSTTPSFSFTPTPAQPQFTAPSSTDPFAAPAAPSTETSKPTPFTFAKPSAPPSSAPTSTSAQANPPSMFGASSSTVAPASAPSAPPQLKFDFGKKAASTTSKLAITSAPSSAATTANASKLAGPSFSFQAATPQANPLGASSQQTFPFGQPSSTSVFGSGGSATAAPKPAETSEAPKPKAKENEIPKFSFGQPTGGSGFGSSASSAPKSMLNFGTPSGTSAFGTTALGGDAKKTETPLSIFGAANATKEDGSKAAAPAPASAVFGGSSFGANGASSNLFAKPSAPPPSGDASTSTSTPKSAFGNGLSSNPFSTTPAGSPAGFGSTQPSSFPFSNGSTKPTDNPKPSPFGAPPSNTSSVFAFGKKEDTVAPSSSNTNASTAPASSTSPFAFGTSMFTQPSTGTSSGPTQQQSVFGKPSAPTPSAFGFGSGTGTGSNTFTFGGQSGGQNQQQ
ncbi:uncharacterized protein EDB91DRAFT_1102881 [Suillus paluster]|uniref:uncharacterized protein n=1 Tax=Suillus paluster TaxID=48578 RepID=UPI001B885B52|nr:uncharacterized protein EDB91DRAFT_1102881 [Suillus paluster]KAG1752487.1 hypothetical protein EDB91DRAFT_1102881 [Suillus paluster]